MLPKMFPNGENPRLHVLVLANIAAKKWRNLRSKVPLQLALSCCVNIQRAALQVWMGRINQNGGDHSRDFFYLQKCS